jgi:hypothetical protein
MTPTTTGRHCAACQKTVVDFTQKTDAEILAALRQAAGETCGRLRADQVGRPLVAPTAAPRWRAWLGAALAVGGVLGAGRAAAQARTNYYAGPQPVASPTSQASAPNLPVPTSPATPEAATPGPLTVRGIVLDSATHKGLPGATVLVKGTDIGVSTDAQGSFVLSVPTGTSHLTFSAIGFINQERPLAAGQPLQVALAADMHMMLGEMGIVVVGGPSQQRPWPWHPRRFFNWGKYWITKPFRAG